VNGRRQQGQRDRQPSGPGDSGSPGGGFGGAGGRGWRILLFVVLGVLLFLWGQRLFGPGGVDGPRIPYSTFRSHLERNNVVRVVVQGERIQGVLNQPATRQNDEGESVQYTEFVTFVPSFGDDDLLQLLEDRNVEVETRPTQDTSWWTILWMVGPFVFLLLIGWMAMRRMRSQGQSMFNIGKAGAKLYDREEEERTTFEDVAGNEGAKKELQEIIKFLTDPERFHKLGGKIPTGVLLVGPPGTGKTLMARAVAGEADVPFFSITGSDFMEMFVGVGAKRVRDLFENAKESSPSIIFIDELDSIGRSRGAGLGGGHDEREQTLNQLLSELDGFEATENVIVMAATNRPDILDQALLRPGRFDRRVTVHLPTQKDRLAILRIHARRKPLASDVDLEALAQGTPGLSGADLENLLNEAALIAARRDGREITRDDLEQARDKVLMGLEREGIVLTDEEREMLAYHESGHALVAAMLPNTDPVHKVTIVPRGRAMGVTQQLPEEDKYIYKEEYMLDRAAVMMGGRAAENLVFDTSTSGAEDDLRQVTKLARQMVLNWGMSDKLGPVSPGGRREQVFLGEEIAQQREYSDETAREVDQEVQRLVTEAYDTARDLLTENREALDTMAERLLEAEELTGDEVVEIVGGTEAASGNGGESPPDRGGEESTTEDEERSDDARAEADGSDGSA